MTNNDSMRVRIPGITTSMENNGDGSNIINPRRLTDEQLAHLMRLSITRQLTNYNNLNPSNINDIGNALLNMDMFPYVSLLREENESLLNLLVEEISLRIYISLYFDHSRDFIKTSVKNVIDKYYLPKWR